MTQRAPKHLRPGTRRWWQHVVGEYDVQPHHRHLLTLSAEALDSCAKAREILDREGMTYTDRFGQPRARPEVAIERDSRLAFARLLRELALDVEAPPAEEYTRPPEIRGKSHLKAG
jgi:P27 family predicted phage terminase small subunit